VTPVTVKLGDAAREFSCARIGPAARHPLLCANTLGQSLAGISKPASGCRSKSALVFSRPILTHTTAPVARLPRTVEASSRKRCVAPWLRRRNLAHEHKRQSGTEHNQERPDKKFQPINRGNVARPQIVPARHGYDPPCPWQFGHNVEPLPWVPSPAVEMLGSLHRAGATACRPSPIRGKVQLLNRLERVGHKYHELSGESYCLSST
jgi:hypothetical protein